MSCCTLSDVFQKAILIAALGTMIGATHSVFRPVVEEVDKTKVAVTNLDNLPNRRAIDTTGGKAPEAATPTTSPAAPSATPTEASAGALGYEISIAQAWAAFQKGIPFVDSRHEPEFNAGHVEGATRVAADEYAARAGELAMYSPGPVVIYCGGGQCDASHNLAKLMQQSGFTQLHIMIEGYPAWHKAGHPIATGGQ